MKIIILTCSLWLVFIGNSFAIEKINTVRVILNKRATCSITVPPTYNLGKLTVGERTLPSFYIDVECNGRVISTVVPSVVQGKNNGSGVGLLVNGKQDINNPTLYFMTKKMNEDKFDVTSINSIFCQSVNEPYVRSSCEIKPVINVPPLSNKGAMSGAVRFSLRYAY